MEMIRTVSVMPEEKDKIFSNKLSERFESFTDSLKVSEFEIEIKEQYIDEVAPHYHLGARSKDCTRTGFFKNGHTISASYMAIAIGKSYLGRMDMRVKSNATASINKILVSTLFAYYDEYIREYYPEWETHYEVIEFPN